MSREYIQALRLSDDEFKDFVIEKLMTIESHIADSKKWESRFYKIMTTSLTIVVSILAYKGVM